ncbi:MAG TPA: hypothetical protein VNU44_09610 [Bryobacteraceae bacterium]|nr:hypothetical protein [Bryobacteraceae bacterium]
MATLAQMYNSLFLRGFEQAAKARGESVRGGGAALRTFANEDIYFFVKRIDNSRVVREADPEARGTCWKLIGSVVSAVVLLIFVLLPSAYGLLAGYQIQNLRQEGERLGTERTSLELAEARLLSPARMEELARIQQFIDPPAQKVVYLENAQAGTVAMNKK